MEQTKPANAQASEAATAHENRPGLVLNNLAARMMQTHRDIAAYERGEMTLEELHALGVRLG